MESTALLQRLGFLCDLVGWQWPTDVRQRILAAISSNVRTRFGRLDRKPGDIGYVHEWGVIVHAAKADLLADVPKSQERPA